MRYSIEPRVPIFVKGYGFFFAKNMSKNISKKRENVISKYIKNFLITLNNLPQVS